MPARFARERAGAGAARLRFEPADRRGVLDGDALASLEKESEALAREPGVRLVVLEGAREDLFAAGADLETIARLTPEDALALASDLVVAFPGARFAQPGAQRGIVTGWGGTARAARRLSGAALTALFSDPEPVTAERAEANGLADLIVRDASELDELVARWAGPAGEPLRELKRVARETDGLSPSQAHVVAESLSKLR